MSTQPTQWTVTCPLHGSHTVTQKTKPTVCKIEERTGPRSTRRCGKTPVSAVRVEPPPAPPIQLKVNRTYRGKKTAPAGAYPAKVNDRTIIWLGAYELQYDGPAVANGRNYPRISIEDFRKWASHDVTDQLPPGDYANWPPAKIE